MDKYEYLKSRLAVALQGMNEASRALTAIASGTGTPQRKAVVARQTMKLLVAQKSVREIMDTL